MSWRVPAADESANRLGSQVLGNKADAPVYSPAAASSLVGMVKGLFGILHGPRTWYVDANSGSNSNSGKSAGTAFLTMATALAAAASGDKIRYVGKIREQLIAPVQVFDVTIVGSGNRPRHADSAPAGGELAANTWTVPASGAVAGKACLRLLQQGWRLQNILWAAEAAAAAVEICRNAGEGNAERDASHAEILNCRFVAGQDGVRCGVAGLYTEIPNNVGIADCIFTGQTGTSIVGAIYANQWEIARNRFMANANHIVLPAGATHIYDNIMGAFTTKSIDLTGGTGTNIITKNYLSGTYSEGGGYIKSNANDEWAGNWNTLAGGITIADPA
jgi:hypothetical protein